MGPAGRALVVLNRHDLGGTQLNAIDLAATLKDFGWHSHLVVPREMRATGLLLEEYADRRGVPLELLDRPRSTLGTARLLSRICRDQRIDLVHAYGGWSARPGYWGPCLLGRRPLVLTVYEMFVPETVLQWPPLVVGTGYLVDDLSDRHGPVTLVSPPVDTRVDDARRTETEGWLAEHQLDGRDPLIVIVSRLDEAMKALAVEASILAMGQLNDPAARLAIVGAGDAERRLRAMADLVNAEVGHRAVVLTGATADPRPAYAAASVVIGMGGSAARALSFGRPLIVSGEYGLFRTFAPETAEDLFRSSFWSPVAEADPVASLLSELRPLIESPGRRAELGRFGRSFAKANFDLAEMATRLAAVYARAVKHQPRWKDWVADLPGEMGQAREFMLRRARSVSQHAKDQNPDLL